MSVVFSAEEVDRIPSELRPLMQQYSLAFDNLLEFWGKPQMAGPFGTLEIYFDDELQPALSAVEGEVLSSPSTEDPTCITLLADNECAYFQIGDRVLLNRVPESILDVFEV